MTSSIRLVASLFLPAAALAQSGPAPRTLGPVVARSAVQFTSISQVVPLSDGSILVSDAGRRQLMMLDASLANMRIVLDSVTGRPDTYSSGIGAGGGRGALAGGGAARGGSGGIMSHLPLWEASFLIPFRGDSSLWYDRDAGVFVVIHPDGSLGRPMPTPPEWTPGPNVGGIGTGFASAYVGVASSSPVLGVVYKLNIPITMAQVQATPGIVLPRVSTGPDSVIVREDSLVALRFDYETRTVDTVAKLAAGRVHLLTFSQGSRGFGTSDALFPFYDDVIAASDGAIGVFRAREYRFDWIAPDGSRERGARLPYPWVRVTDARRQQIIDSINGGRQRIYDSLLAKRAADSAANGAVPTVDVRSTVNGITSIRQMPQRLPSPPVYVRDHEISDYLPPTRQANLRADADGNVWLVPAHQPEAGFVVHDVVSRSEGLIDRVRIPEGRTIAGFAPGGFVFLVARDGGVATLEKVKVRP